VTVWFKATRGAYNSFPMMRKVALNIAVVRSEDSRCPVGAVGKLSLIDDLGPAKPNEGYRYPDDRILLRLCGSNHTHTFTDNWDVPVVKVWIREQK